MFFTNKLRYLPLALILITPGASAAILNIEGGPEGGDFMGSAVAAGDFNCDGFDDLAIGVSREDVGSNTDTGIVNIVYGGTGSNNWLGTPGNNYLHLPDAFHFGEVLATGDFDGDGCGDLAVGMPSKRIAGNIAAGEVVVYYGHGNGLGTTEPEIWNQNTPDVDGGSEEFDYFGASLVAGDFNGDGYDDLAIGIPGENNGAGWVYVLHGQPLAGLTTLFTIFMSQDTPGLESAAEPHDSFGESVVSGDFNGDGYGDLAIGSPRETQGTLDDAGGVHVLYGSASSLSGAGSQWWQQNSAGIQGANGIDDFFGHSLAAGDFDNDGRDDLAIGVPFEGTPAGGSILDSIGAVNVIYGTNSGLSATRNQYWQGNDPSLSMGVGSRFGWRVVAGDFNADGRDDLTVSAPWRRFNGLPGGAVQVFYGAALGLASTGTMILHQNLTLVEGVVETDDEFGYSLAAGDFNGDNRSDLTVGIPGDRNSGVSSGSAHVFYTITGVFGLLNNQLVVQ
jgi:hypothetical protein